MGDPFVDASFTALEHLPDVDLYQRDDIGLIVMNRFKDDRRAARQAANHLDEVLMKQVMSALSDMEKNDGISSIILTSAHRMAFSRGAKIEIILDRNLEEALEVVSQAQEIILHLQRLKKPVIAAVNGLAFGGGFEVAMACDYRIAGDRNTVVFGLPEASLGVIAGMGGTQNLANFVGKDKCNEYMISAQGDINFEKALEHGIADKVVPYADLITEAYNFAKAGNLKKAYDADHLKDGTIDRETVRAEIKDWLANEKTPEDLPGKAAPLSRKLIYFVAAKTSKDKYGDALIIEQEAFSYLVTTADAQEGVKALIEGREASFQGK